MTCRLSACAAACLLTTLSAVAMASSHREAPFIAGLPQRRCDRPVHVPKLRARTPGLRHRSSPTTMPFQDPQGGPNFYMFNPNAQYEIHIDNDGDGVEDLSFQFRFKNTSKATALTIGGKR